MVGDVKYDVINSIKVTMNTKLFQMFGGAWQYQYLGIPDPNAINLEYWIMIYNQLNNQITLVPVGVNPAVLGYQMWAEFVSANLKDICKLVITSTLPIAKEYVPAIGNTSTATTTGQNARLAIMTDLLVDDVWRKLGTL